jgi:hypothetical protein
VRWIFALGCALALVPAPLRAQEEPVAVANTIRVFLDCNSRNCDSEEFRTEIRFVDWVRDRTVADVQVIMTSQETGAGTEYTFDFIGLKTLEGLTEKLRHVSSSTDTRDEQLTALTRVLRVGLVPFMIRAGYPDLVEVRARDGMTESTSPQGTAAANDPWKAWVFRAGVDFDFEGEELQEERRLGGSFSANRTTEQWKIDVEMNGNYRHQRVELDSSTFIDDTNDWSVRGLGVRSIDGHWSVGAETEMNTSTRFNREFSARAAAAIEWDLFPYAEANRRWLIVHYQIGIARVRYEEITIFDKEEETLGDQRLSIVYDTRQPWGSASAGLRLFSYLHDLSKNHASVSGEINFRVFRGFNLDLEARYEKINDQIYLSAEGLTDAEKLVQRGQLATGYEYEVSMGFSYRFGSIFNNVVNSRFPFQVRF